MLLDWLIENNSPFATPNEFVTDVFVDGVHVNRWTHTQSPPFQKFGIRNWEGINDNVRLGRGDHTFRLVVDALDQINETDETDNEFEWTFTWGGEPLSGPKDGDKAVNLTPAALDGMAAPVVVAPVPGAYQSGLMSVLSPAYVSWGVTNAGLLSTDSDVDLHLYFDDILLQRRFFTGISASSVSGLSDWDELHSLVRIEPGPHKLRIVVDPGNFIAESDESDNEYEVELEWLPGPTVAPPGAPIPTPVSAPEYKELTEPNLTAFTRIGWDGAIVTRPVADATGATVGVDLPLSASDDIQVDYIVRNSSSVDASSSFEVQLLLDDEVIDTTRANSLPSRFFLPGTYVIPAFTVTPGVHELSLRIDPGSKIAETNEDDNLYSRLVSLSASPALPVPAATTYSFTALRDRLEILPELLLETGHVSGSQASSRVWVPTILDIAEAGYFLATGTALVDERLTIELLKRDDYEIRVMATCLEDRDTLTQVEFAAELASCRQTVDRSIGLQSHWEGRVVALVDTDHTPAQVLSSLFHELGHARQELVAPTTSDTPTMANSAVKEAQAQVFEATIWRHIEEFLDTSLTSYRDLNVQREYVQHVLATTVSGSEEPEEHDLGYILMWMTALQDPAGLGIDNELRLNGTLDAASSLDLYEYLLTIAPSEAPAWVDKRLTAKAALINEFEAISLGRLIDGLADEAEGHPDLRDITFRAP